MGEPGENGQVWADMRPGREIGDGHLDGSLEAEGSKILGLVEVSESGILEWERKGDKEGMGLDWLGEGLQI